MILKKLMKKIQKLKIKKSHLALFFFSLDIYLH